LHRNIILFAIPKLLNTYQFLSHLLHKKPSMKKSKLLSPTYMKKAVKFIAFNLALLMVSISVFARTLQPDDISIPNDYKIEVAVDGLSAPTMVVFDDQGRMLIAESGFDGGGSPKVTRIEKDGKKYVLTKDGVFANEVPVTAVAFYQSKVYVVHAGTVSTINDDGSLKNIITGLPGQGDHQANQLVFKDGKMYLTIGTVTNSAVVGPDNAVFGWLKKPELKELHEVPCQDITLTNSSSFESDDIAGTELPKAKTSAYAAFGKDLGSGALVTGDTKCNGAVLRANSDSTDLEVVAWGLRNPYGLELGPDNNLYLTMHGFDARGSRPVENAWDCFYRVDEGEWYGWPDFACDFPVTDPQFKPKDQPQPQFLISNHPTENPPKPLAKFSPHAAANGFAFAQNGWGKPTDAFVALFGDFTPATGTVAEPQGVKIVKVDTTKGEISDFITNRQPGQASKNSAGGLEHPSDVTFGPDGAMYIADWGVANISVEGLKLEKDSGVIWKVTKTAIDETPAVAGPSQFNNIFLTLLLMVATIGAAWGTGTAVSFKEGVIKGAVGGLVMGAFTMFVAAPVLKLPWYAPPRVLATLLMGQAALANILEFELVSFVLGVVVLLLLTGLFGGVFALILRTTDLTKRMIAGALFGLTVWSLLQYVILPWLQPLIVEKGFPPIWYALSFAVYGLVTGILLRPKS
jgi:glucose/arabinose dehydrogenase